MSNEAAEIIFSKKITKNPIAGFIEDLKKDFCSKWLDRLAKKNLSTRQRQLAVLSWDAIGKEIFLDGVYEKLELEALFEWLSTNYPDFKKASAVDIGANIGNHSLYFSDYFSRVFSFEPNARVFRVLKLNSELVENVECYNFGLSNNTRSSILNLCATNIGASSISNTFEFGQTVNIELRRFDDVYDSDLRIALMKIDVEGHEYEVLEGSQLMIKKYCPVVAFEQNESEFNGGTTKSIELLKTWGYKKFATVEASPTKNKKYPKSIRGTIFRIRKILFGKHIKITMQTSFEHKSHSLIIAIPEWVSN